MRASCDVPRLCRYRLLAASRSPRRSSQDVSVNLSRSAASWRVFLSSLEQRMSIRSSFSRLVRLRALTTGTVHTESVQVNAVDVCVRCVYDPCRQFAGLPSRSSAGVVP